MVNGVLYQRCLPNGRSWLPDLALGIQMEPFFVLTQQAHQKSQCHQCSYLVERSKNISELSKELQRIAPEMDGVDGLGNDHGVVAAAHLNSTLKRFGKKAKLRFHPAVRAIAFHNTRAPQVDAGRDPVAALLILCDSLQEWRRAHLGFSQSPAVVLSRMIEAASAPADDQFGSLEQFRFAVSSRPIDGAGHPHAEHHWEAFDSLEVRLDYNDRVLRNGSVFFLWMDATYNLQRVDFRPWKLKMEVKYSTPFASGQRQIDRLTDLVHDRTMSYAERWLEVATSGVAGAAVAHSIPDGATREIITMDLSKLGEEFANRTELLGGTVGDFFTDLWNWPPYAEERNVEEEYRQTPPV